MTDGSHSHTKAEVRDLIDSLAADCFDVAVSKGWWEEDRSFGDLVALMHSELSEALEEYREGYHFSEIYIKDGKPEGIPIEFADVLIRIFDVCGRYQIPLGQALVQKMAFNRDRPHRHGGKVM